MGGWVDGQLTDRPTDRLTDEQIMQEVGDPCLDHKFTTPTTNFEKQVHSASSIFNQKTSGE